jgi:alpha-glucosidase (family GH31 glycosyl hydrolase)
MENGGNGEHRPWMYDEETLQIYRQFVKLHHELIPYLYSEGASAYEQGRPLMQPQSGSWQYLLGNSIFGAAITNDVTRRTIDFPPGAWIDFWSGDVYPGPSTVDYSAPLDRYPIFLRRGDIIPLKVVDDALGHGDARSAHLLTVLIHPVQEASFHLYEDTSRGATIRYRCADALTVEVSAIEKEVLLLIRGDRRPAAIMTEPWGNLPEQPDRDTFAASARGWQWDPSRQELWIKPGAAGQGLRIQIRPAFESP